MDIREKKKKKKKKYYHLAEKVVKSRVQIPPP
jgi:hypothetical protein